MIKPAVKIAKKAFHTFGLEISRYRPDPNALEENPLGSNPLSDVRRLARSHPALILDVGANVGQSTKEYKELMPQAEVHAFEPSPETYKLLVQNVNAYANVYLNNLAVGSAAGHQTFLENSYSNMSSFLEPGADAWGKIVKKTEVEVTTVDKYCAEKNIPYVSLLKTDTQGYDFEVLKGASELMGDNRIELVFMEVTFSAMYKNLPAFDEIYRFLLDRNFKLVSFYQFRYQQELAGWTDALFRNTSFDHSKTGRS